MAEEKSLAERKREERKLKKELKTPKRTASKPKEKAGAAAKAKQPKKDKDKKVVATIDYTIDMTENKKKKRRRKKPGQEVIFIATRLTDGGTLSPAEVDSNTLMAQSAAALILARGHVPVFTHCLSALGIVDQVRRINPDAVTHSAMMDVCLNLLRKCDAVLHLEPSKGADLQVKAAVRARIKVYTCLSDIPIAKKV